MSEGEGKYHRQWASTVASKALSSQAGGDEVEEGEGREERYCSGDCWTQVIRLPTGPCEM